MLGRARIHCFAMAGQEFKGQHVFYYWAKVLQARAPRNQYAFDTSFTFLVEVAAPF